MYFFAGSAGALLSAPWAADQKYIVDRCESAVLCLWRTALCIADDYQYFHQLFVWQTIGNGKQEQTQRDSSHCGNHQHWSSGGV